ncbi:MAG: hypothetical protein K9G62_07760 [Alphaproteobacteria bacterium]|nr:hypothetical protein [Alphaproteobacteria bacterium]
MTSPLLEGFLKFRADHYEGECGLMNKLVEEGQSPDYFIISCIDSRSNPGTIFRPAPGTFFAHKAMGAIVRPYKKGTALSAALTFALDYNGVKEIVILGHTGCGAVKALIEDIDDEEIASFMEVARSGLKRAQEKHACENHHDDLHRHAEEEIVLLSAENLKTYPCVARALAEGQVTIKPWLFDMEGGQLFEYDEEEKEFKNLSDVIASGAKQSIPQS